MKESLGGTLNYTDPNYDFLGNSINYSFISEKMINQIKVMKTTIISAGVNTSFEQYKDVFVKFRFKCKL